MGKRDELLRIFAGPIRELLGKAAPDWEKVQEIRLRAGRPVFVVCDGQEYVLERDGLRETEALFPAGGGSRKEDWRRDLRQDGPLQSDWQRREMRQDGLLQSDWQRREMRQDELLQSGRQRRDRLRHAYRATQQDLRETLEAVSGHSLYAFEEEIRQGFITIQGGHRIGLAGKTVMDERGVRTIKYVSFLNVRLAHQVRGCADPVMPYLLRDGQALHTLIVSPPRCGKTTLLRDAVRQLSDGYAGGIGAGTGRADKDIRSLEVKRPVTNVRNMGEGRQAAAPRGPGESSAVSDRSERVRGFTVGVVDERSELAACWQGIPQNDLGARTDVLDCCPKAKGMMMLVRAMSPEVIAVDEIGGKEDIDAMRYVMNCGCRVLATVHGDCVEDVARKPVLGDMVRERMFDRYVVLSSRNGVGTVEEIRDRDGRRLDAADGPEPDRRDGASKQDRLDGASGLYHACGASWSDRTDGTTGPDWACGLSGKGGVL